MTLIRELTNTLTATPMTSIKNDFIFYLRIPRYSKVIQYFVYHCQSYHEAESKTQR